MTRSILAASLLLASPLAAQTTVFSNFGPGGTFGGSSLLVSSDTPSQIAVATWFTYDGPVGGSLYDVQLAAFNTGGTLEVGFYQGATVASLALLESWSVPETTPAGIFGLSSVLQPELTLGTTYWLWLSMTDPGGYWAWNFAGNGALGAAFTTDGGDTWNVTSSDQPAFAVRILDEDPISGDVVPEPATLTLLATGTAALLATRRRRRG